jgi:hypothetical protein
LHTATRWQGRIRGAGDKTLRDASSRATKAFYPALSLRWKKSLGSMPSPAFARAGP